MNHPYQKLESHPLWTILSDALSDLVKNKDVQITTSENHVVGYLLSKLLVGTPIVVNWDECSSEADFYDAVLPQCGSPPWHGRNLDALADAWIAGGIDTGGPPYEFHFMNGHNINRELISFRDAVERIACASVGVHGGKLAKQQQTCAGQPATHPESK